MENVPVGFALLCGGFFFLIILAAGGGLVFFNLRSHRKAELSRDWPGVQGKVTVSTVRETSSTDDDGYASTYYHPKVEFEYEVGGQTHTGKHVSFGGSTGYGHPAQAKAKLEHYPVGALVQVYYNPERPSEAVLERQAGGFKLGMAIGIVLLAISACIGCMMTAAVIRNFMGG
ncbi:MAG: DUF3592 domain-containing protein [Anaerolineaceae bacterium]|nr:DUF3592 domain-containing protein [Anaerolineaceae bacterium]